jgi:hypothetical protein
MRVFGYSIPLFVLFLVVFVVGAKNPGLLARVPLLNRL